jgi:hypothetical protein
LGLLLEAVPSLDEVVDSFVEVDDLLSLLFVGADSPLDADRESVMYQPLPLNTMPTG